MTARTAYVLANLHPTYKAHLDSLKKTAEQINSGDTEFDLRAKKLARAEIRGYLTALNDASLITNHQFRVLYTCYTLNL